MPLLRADTYSARLIRCALLWGFLGLEAGCSGGGGSGGAAMLSTNSAPIIRAIEITPANAHLAAGTKAQLTATAVLSDNTHKDITAQVAWASSNTTAATIGSSAQSSGMATALSPGSTTISATTSGVMGQTMLAVTAATLTSIEVTPPSPTAAKGTTAQFRATGVFSDRSTQELTSQVRWSSAEPAVATISSAAGSAGLALARDVGSTHITAAFDGVTSPPAGLTVIAATLTSIQLTPPSVSIPNGLTQQFTATGVYSDNSTQDLTSMVTWVSSDPGVASLSNTAGSAGLAAATSVGSATIGASLGAVKSLNANLTVTAATLTAIEVTPPSPNLASGLTQQFTATGIYTDNSTQNLTSAVTWSSSNASVATVSNAPGSNGVGVAAGVGTSSITAAFGLVTSQAATMTVSPATLVSIQVTPPSPSVAAGLTQPFTATGTYTDDSSQNLTLASTWSSSNSAVATISNASGSNGVAFATGTGATYISATLDGVTSPTVSLAVTTPTLASIQVTPPNPSIANGLTQKFTATGVYTDNSTEDLTTFVTWASSDTSAASISNAAGSIGLATATGAGSTGISASYNGVTSPDAALTVTAATLVSIQVTPPGPSVANGLAQQFTATGIYTDNSTQDLTATVTWMASDGTVASISNAGGSSGLATATKVGAASITANLNGITSLSATLYVTAATLVSIQVTPPSPSVANGLTQQFTATGIYTDNSAQDLTAVATWHSTNPDIATVSSASGSSGLATAAGVGSTSIGASYNGVTSPDAALSVTAAKLLSIEVSPLTPSTAKGLTQQFIATGTYTDNSTANLTTAVTWTSSDAGVASISNATGSNGLAASAAVGTTSISASYNGVTSPDAILSVTPATLVSIQVAPSSASITNGAAQQFTATGTYTDNSTQDLTGITTWASSSTVTATVSNAAGSNGLATSAGLGSTSISASYNAVASPSATLTVVAATSGVAGVWTATAAPGETAGMISDAAGNFYFFTSTATCLALYNGTLSVAGSTVSGAGDFMPYLFGPNSGCPTAVHENYSGSLVPGVSMTLSMTPTGGGATTSTITWTFDPSYGHPSALTLIAGSWGMPGGSVASISSTGVIAAHDAATGCTISGQVSVSDTTVNLYNVSATYSGCTGGAAALNGVALSGLGTLDNSVTPTHFDAALRSANKKTMSGFDWAQQ